MQHLAHEALEALKPEGLDLDILPIPQFDQIYYKTTTSTLDESRLRRPTTEDPVLILHSSGAYLASATTPQLNHFAGSTAFPKPIYSTTKQFLEYGMLPCKPLPTSLDVLTDT